MGARSYVPQLGRFLQPDPVPGGSANAYAYTFGDPVNTSDPSGESTGTPPLWAIQAGAQVAEEDVARRAAEEAAARTEAARKEREAEAAASAGMNWEEKYAMGGGPLGGPEEGRGQPGEVLWEGSGASGCTGNSACASGLFSGFKVVTDGIVEWWKKTSTAFNKGWELVKESVLGREIGELFKENSTVCKTVGYTTSAGSYFIPEARFAKILGVVLGVGTTFAC